MIAREKATATGKHLPTCAAATDFLINYQLGRIPACRACSTVCTDRLASRMLRMRSPQQREVFGGHDGERKLVSHFGTRTHLAAQKIKLVNDAVMAICASPQCIRREINVEKSETDGSKDYSESPDQ